MTDKKPGIFKRIFSFIGKILTGVRYLFSFVILVFFVSILAGTFGDAVPPVPEKGALYLAPQGVLVDQKTYTDPLNQKIAEGHRDGCLFLVLLSNHQNF